MQKLIKQGTRKTICIILALVMALTFLVPFLIPPKSANAVTYAPESNIQVTLALSSNPGTANNLQYTITYNTTYFSLVGFQFAEGDGAFSGEVSSDPMAADGRIEYHTDGRPASERTIIITYPRNGNLFANSDTQIGTYTFKVRENTPYGTYDNILSVSLVGARNNNISIPAQRNKDDDYRSLMVITGNSIEVGEESTDPDPDPTPPFEVACGYGGNFEYDDDAEKLTFIPIEGYALDVLYVDGVPWDAEEVQGAESYELDISDEEFEETKSIVATFAHTINFTQPDNGSLSVVRSNTTLGSDEELNSGDIVRDGELLTITATPEEDYELAEIDGLVTTGLVAVDGEEDTYRVEAPRGDGDEPPTLVSVSAAFELAVERYAITLDDAIANGTVTPDRVLAAAGSFVAVSTEPSAGYELSELTYRAEGDEEPTPIVRGGFFMPEGPVTIDARFTELTEAALEISTPAQMAAFRDAVNAGTDYADQVVRLTADIDLSAYPEWLSIGQQIQWTSDHPYTPPFARYNAFKGSFDGAGYTVTLGIDMDPYVFYDPRSEIPEGELSVTYQYAGLFGYVEGAEIQNLTVDGSIDLHAQHGIRPSHLGAVVAHACETTLRSCTSYVNISITGSSVSHVGGVVGYLSHSTSYGYEDNLLAGCSNYGRIEVPISADLGGVAGIVSGGNITDCMNAGELVSLSQGGITQTGGVVGLVSAGNNASSLISGCYNTGSVSSASLHIAGIANSSKVDIIDCYNAGSLSCIRAVTSSNPLYIAGISAYLSEISISNSYNVGTISYVGSPSPSVINADDIAPTSSADPSTIDKNDYPIPANCYIKKDSFTAADLSASFKDDKTNINGGYPLLVWQNAIATSETYRVAFDVIMPEGSEAEPVVTLYSDAERTKAIIPEQDGSWSFTKASNIAMTTYYYALSAVGCMPEVGSFNVGYTDVIVRPALRLAATVSLTLTPADGYLTLTGPAGAVAHTSRVDGVYTYTVYAGDVYTYRASRSGYNSTMREFAAADGANITVALTSQATPDKGTITPNAQGVTITEGGSYRVAHTSTSGIINIATTDSVTLMGTGSSTNDVYDNLYIDCTVAGVDLTLQDIYLTNNVIGPATRNMLAFTGTAEGEFEGTANTLHFKGTVILDLDTRSGAYAMVHVAPDVALTIEGDADAALYLNEHGSLVGIESAAVIGGNGGESNGEITFAGGTVFARNAARGISAAPVPGAVIGSGSAFISVIGIPSPITVQAGSLNIIVASESAAIGSATGSEVRVHPGAALNIDVDSSGVAIGAGTLTYLGGTLRSYVGYNATDPNGDGDSSDTLWEGITAPGISDTPITADKVDGAGNPLSLLSFDTALLTPGASEFEAYLDESEDSLYTGTLHHYGSINADRPASSQLPIAYTMDNWAPLTDSSLYLYATAANHSLTVNGEDFKAYWAGDVPGAEALTGSFLVTPEGSARDILASAIAEAEELLASTVSTEDGNTVAPEDKWAPPADWESYSEAIAAAWQAALDATTNDVTLQGATTSLGEATSAFSDAASNGTHKGSVADLTVSGINSQGYTYTAKAIEPTITVKDGGDDLIKDTDYTVAYANNTNVGSATLTITGTGAYDGELAIPFTINPAPLTITVDAKTKYLGSPDPPYSYSAVGLKAPDRLTSLTLTRSPGETVGSYDITARGAVVVNGNTNVSANYAPNYVKATLSVLPLLESSWPRLDGGKTDGGRYDTMQAIVGEGWTSSEYVIVASGANFPDALAASSLAGIYGAPVILTESATLSFQAEETIKSLGATKAFLIGGEAALSPASFAALEAILGEGKVARISGDDRIATSLDLYEKGRSPEGGNPTWSDTAIIANGFSFADALSVSPFAHATRSPIFLSTPETGLDEATLGAIQTGGFKKVVITGGVAAVPAIVEAQLASSGVTIERWSGDTRYETSVDIVKHSLADSGGVLTLNNLVCATGDNYPDALAGGAFAGHTGSVLLLVHATQTGGLAGLDLICEHKDEIGKGYVLGGPAAVPEALLQILEGGSQGR